MPWGKLLRLIEQLPQGSAYWAARLDDEELAELIHKEDDGKPKRRAPSLTEMTLQTQLLMSIVDGLGGVISCLEALGGAVPRPVKPLPRPLTALDRVSAKAEAKELTELEAETYAAMERSKENT